MNTISLSVRAASTAIWLALAAIQANAANYELASGFDPVSNPGAVWSCGWFSTIGGEFRTLTFQNTTASDNGVVLRAWQYSSSEQPAVNWNGTTNVAIVYGGLSSFAPGDVFLHPGPDGSTRNFGAVRFTLPLNVSGLYRLETAVSAVLTNGPASDTDFYVVKNGREVVGWVLPAGKGVGYTNQMQLTPGETVDFLIGRGADGHEYGGALKIRTRFVPLNVVTSQPPVIVAQPQSQTVVSGTIANFTVSASGTPPLAYRWYFNGIALASATNAALALNNVQPGQAGDYRAVVANAAGSVTSVVATLTVTGASNPVWDVSSFSPEANPGPVWSYGWFSEVAGPFHLLTFAKGFNSDNGVAVRSWQYSNTEQPVVHWNSSTNPAILYGGQAICGPGAVWFHPGPEGSGHNFSAVRFTAPAGVSGSYRLESAFPPFWVGASASDTDIHVVQNGVEIFSQFLTGTNGTTFTNTLNLAAGDTVDFLIGRGRDDRYYGDGLKIQARFVALPGPTVPAAFDVAAFSSATNPGPVWSYGWFTNIGGKFTLLTFAKTPPADNGVPINTWQYSEYEEPVVAWNGTTNIAIVFGGQTAFPPGSVWFHPGPDGSPRNFGAIRFTVPTGASGSYRLESAVAAVLTNSPSGDTDFHVVKKGAEIFGQFLAAGRGTTFTNELTLATGDAVDFLIGRGADGHLYGSGLKISARFVPLNVVTSQVPVILAQPQSRTVVTGSNVTFSVTASGTPPLSYRWLFNNGVIASATNSSFVINNVQPSQAGDYRVVVANATGSATSVVATLTVVLPSNIAFDLSKDYSGTNNPSGVWSYGWVSTIGGPFTLLATPHSTITPEGARILSWQLSEALPPAVHYNSSTNTGTSDGGQGVYPPGTLWVAPGVDGRPENFGAIRFTVPNNAGGLYRVETSVRTYLDGPSGGDTDFHVVKAGAEVFSQFLATPSSGGYTNLVNLMPAETVDLLVGRGQDGRLYGSGLKVKATFTRIETNAVPPLIVAQPQSRSVAAGSNATFSVAASGTAPLSYRWLFNNGVIASATNAMLTLSNVQSTQAGDYRVVVANLAGSVTSAVATLTVVPPPSTVFDLAKDFSPTNNPNGVWRYGYKQVIGGSFSNLAYHRIGVSGEGVPIQIWEFSPNGDPAVFHNATTNTATSDGGAGVYPPGTIWFAPGFDGQPQNFGAIRFTVPPGGTGLYRLETSTRTYLDRSPGGDADFHVVKNGVELFGQFLATPSEAGYTNVLGLVSGETIDLLVGRGQDGSLYGSGLKIKAVLTRIETNAAPPVIVAQPQSRTVAAGSNATFSVTASGMAPLSYRWLFNNGPLASATNAMLTLSNVQSAQAGDYRVVVANAAGSVTSVVATLTVIVPPACAPPSSGLVGWWPLDGGAVDIAGTNSGVVVGSPVFSAGKVGPGMVFDGVDDEVNVAPSPSLNVGVGNGFTLELWVNPTDPTRWQPLVEWNNRQGTVGLHLSIAQPQPYGGGPGSIWANLIDNAHVAHWFPTPAGLLSSNTWTHVALTYDKASGIARIYADGVVAAQTNVGSLVMETTYEVFFGRRVAVSGSNYFYRGGMDEISLYNRALSANEVQAIYLASDAGKCRMSSPPVILAQPQSRTVAAGSNATFAVSTGGTPPLTYRWLFNNGAIASATNSVLALNNVQPAQAGDYRVVVANAAGSVTSAVATLTVLSNNNPAFDTSNFSVATNPGPAWSYGWMTNIGGRFQTLTYAKSTLSDNGVALRAWQYSDSEQPAVNWNSTTNLAIIYGGMSSLAGGEILFYSGPDGTPRNFGVIRLTVPAGQGGAYRLESVVAAVLTNGLADDTDFHIAINGTEIFGRFLAVGQGTGFTNQLALVAGDTVDFMIGRGANGHDYGGALKIRSRLLPLSGANLQSPRVVSINDVGGSQVEVGIDGVLGSVVEIQASTNLVDWSPLTNCFNRNGAVRIDDPNRPRAPMRFYRARSAGN